MRTYHIYTQTPSILTVNGVNCGEFVNIECEDSDSFSVSVMPLDGNMPYAFTVTEELTLPQNVRVYRLPRSHFDIIAEKTTAATVIKRYSVMFENERISAALMSDGILWVDTVKFKLPQTTSIPELFSITINGHPYLEIVGEGYLGIFGKNYNYFSKKTSPLIDADDNNSYLKLIGIAEGDIINRQGEEIKAQAFYNDIANRAKISVFRINADTLKKIEEYNIYLDGTPKRPADRTLYPLAFLQAVLCRDFDEARYYLSDELNEQLSDSDMAEFFAFVDIYPCCYYPDNCIVLIDKNDNGSLFKITYNEDYIENIEELD